MRGVLLCDRQDPELSDGSDSDKPDSYSGEEDASHILAFEDETLKQVAARLNMEVAQLLALNKHRYKGLTSTAKLQGGTIIMLPEGTPSDEDSDEAK